MIVLDMDGVLVDFCQAAYRTHGRTQAANEPAEFDFFEQWGMTADEFWEPINQRGPEWWRDIPIFPWAADLMEVVKSHVDFIVATASSHHGHSAAGKVEALQKIFGDKFRDYFITPRKWLLAAPDRILIDDNEENCDRFRMNGGWSILFPQPWNRNRAIAAQSDSWTARIEFVKNNLMCIPQLRGAA